MENARKTAVEILCEIEKNSAYSNITLNKYLSKEISKNDKNFIYALVYGVLDRKITLDFIISKFVKKSADKIKPTTLNALRIGIYQLKYMDKIPSSAAVNESVKIVKKSSESYNSAFVNAVLRNYIRQGCMLPEDGSLKSMSVRLSCPEDLLKIFISDYGLAAAQELLSSFLSAPPIYLRVNNLKTTDEKLISEFLKSDIKTEKVFENCLKVISGEIDFNNNLLFKNGFFHIQDIASQKSIEKFSVSKNDRILDMCSSPGGKAFTMAQIICDKGSITACDIYEKRTELIKKGAKRLGINCIETRVSDATVFDPELGLYDKVLCDVPCSGLGVIRRKPEIKYKKMKYKTKLEDIQFAILQNADKYLRPGGSLMYSTCTLKKSENEDIIKSFLDKYPAYELQYYHTYLPHDDGTDGFFCALMKKSR